ncbi:DNA repair protein RecN [Thioalkalivibrio sp. XN279]|uniref:DNA repair protein RecN n=1 Tax=Thioalkalivibrio sp. XN279 TaxID=2714953 RepID=UPI00140C5336|nr:DNA repair protein RecN [Thioalkalivibrio sp. XN279]NHA14585.1 DNA repair protein RecN [Thioalkalivibrio sp. XN279]
MLTSVSVRNFAIIDQVSLELGPGLTVLTGETGAGKSILVDALGLVLGDRADAGAVRHGAERAEITATFELAGLPEAAAWLEEHELDADDECVLRRVIGAEGRSRAWINGAPATLQTLRELGEMLVDIHGQHEHQSLGRAAAQRELLDARLPDSRLVTAVRDAWQAWRDAKEERDRLRGAARDREQRLDLLRYQHRELEAFAPEAGEAGGLETEYSRLANAGRLAEGAGGALELVYEGEHGSAHGAVSRAAEMLATLLRLDPRLAAPQRLLAEAEIQLSEAAAELRSYVGDLEMDPARLDAVQERLEGLKSLAHKHQVEADELPARRDALEREIEELEQAEVRLGRADAQVAAAEQAYRRAAAALGAARSAAAGSFSAQVTALMQQLGMPGGRFMVAVAHDPQGACQPQGLDDIEFRVTANPGQPPAPVARVASGGELSRISLAIQVAAKTARPIPVMVFDEVDSGVGGGVAEIVGRRLAELGARAQVLCVTHLPQVASQAQHHLRVAKLTDGETTRTTLKALTEAEKVEELARMLGGVEITGTTRAHAREMRKRAAPGGAD